MNQPFQKLTEELKPMLVLAWPVVLAELGWMTMGLVDTMMAVRASAEAIGAVRVGQAIGRRDTEPAGRSGWIALFLPLSWCVRVWTFS